MSQFGGKIKISKGGLETLRQLSIARRSDDNPGIYAGDDDPQQHPRKLSRLLSALHIIGPNRVVAVELSGGKKGVRVKSAKIKGTKTKSRSSSSKKKGESTIKKKSSSTNKGKPGKKKKGSNNSGSNKKRGKKKIDVSDIIEGAIMASSAIESTSAISSRVGADADAADFSVRPISTDGVSGRKRPSSSGNTRGGPVPKSSQVATVVDANDCAYGDECNEAPFYRPAELLHY